jgi:F-type H+-transporting ATPase subunit gamma
MPNLKDIKTRITSVKKTRQITQAMKLVAAAKLRRATENAVSAKPYQQHLKGVLGRVAGAAGDIEHPLLQPRDEVKTIEVAVLTSDRGLCGGFNNNLLRNALPWFGERRDESKTAGITVYGRKGAGWFEKRGHAEREPIVDYGKTPKMDLVRPLADRLVASFIDGEADEVWMVFNTFVNALVQDPTFIRLLPIEVAGLAEEGAGGDYRYEPGTDEILSNLLPLYVRTVVQQAFLETEAGELAARMTAMDNATRNASDLIDSLTLDYNRARQAAITTELIEIVSGAEAL